MVKPTARYDVDMASRHEDSTGHPGRSERYIPVWAFAVFYLGWAHLFWSVIVVSGEPVWSIPYVGVFVIGGVSPLLAGLVLTWYGRGRTGLATLWRRIVDVRRIRPRWWVVIVLFYPAFNLAIAGIALASGATTAPLEVFSGNRLLDPMGFVGLVAFALVMPLTEEIGLRGYWLDRLQGRWNALTASLLLGVVWAPWHVPLLFMEGYYSVTTFQPEPVTFLGNIVFGAVIYTWIYNNTDRSVLAVVVFHFVGNLTGEVVGLAPELHVLGFVGTVLVAGIIALHWGLATPHRGSRPARRVS